MSSDKPNNYAPSARDVRCAAARFDGHYATQLENGVIPKDSVLRVARPTDRLNELSRMYVDGLGFRVLSEFHDHDGFDGVILGHPKQPYHLEFTHHKGKVVGGAPTKDNLLVFYVPHREAWARCCSNMVAAGFKEVVSYNEYWDRLGKTFEDVDNYRIVIQNDTWSK